MVWEMEEWSKIEEFSKLKFSMVLLNEITEQKCSKGVKTIIEFQET